MEWNITQKQVSKVLDFGLRIRVSKISDLSQFLETVQSLSIQIKEPNWVNLDNLFETLKKGSKNALKMQFNYNVWQNCIYFDL